MIRINPCCKKDGPSFWKASLTRFWKPFSSLAIWSLENTLRFTFFIFLEDGEESWMRGTYVHGQREKMGQKCHWRCSFFPILPDRMFLMEKGRSDILSLLGLVSSVQSMVGNWKGWKFSSWSWSENICCNPSFKWKASDRYFIHASFHQLQLQNNLLSMKQGEWIQRVIKSVYHLFQQKASHLKSSR